jgi:phosphotransferase system  glucose/maltose/N-acetylglucosamine-specific IIC component
MTVEAQSYLDLYLDTYRVHYFVCSNYFMYNYVFSYSVSCYFAFIVLSKNKNQKTKNKKTKKKENPKTAPTTF